MDQSPDDEIAAMRAFNRFYTRQMGLLDEGLLKSAFSLAESRVIYELAHRDGLVATDLTRDLGLDAGYLSRLLKKFEARGLLTRTTSNTDARQTMLALTPAGREAFEPLDRASRNQIAAMLEHLAAAEREKLIKAIKTVQRLLGGTEEPKAPYIRRPLHVGDIGWIIHRQGILYAEEYGWDEPMRRW
jgi:DNA-binding MarR family transcriptional regulator